MAINLLENILNFNPIKRFSASQCLQHPFFQCYDILSVYGLKLNNSLMKENSFPLQNEKIDLNSNISNNSNPQNKNKEIFISNGLSSLNTYNTSLNDKKKVKINTVNFINSLNSNSNNLIIQILF